MRRNPRLFRLTTTVALGALLWDVAPPVAAVAQPAPPPLPPPQDQDQGQPGQNQGDPPARVGRVASISGAVSFHNQGDTQWSTASVNYPVSSGNAFWTQPSAETQLEVSDSRIALAGSSEFDIYTLDAGGLQGVAEQGETYYHLRDLAPNEQWSVQTPRGLVRFGGEGRYDIVVGTTDQPTLVTVVEGSAQIEGPGVSLQVGANQTATISGTDTFQGSVGPAMHDAFLTERLTAERPPPAPTGVPAQVAVMAGGSDLYAQGSWSQAPEYGEVWYPPVQQGWVPYRQGRWAYVAPWGWTWIDDAPWGFAPFHYGRWVQIGGRWAWTPGVVAVAAPPVYAPALVAFIGIGAGVALGAALASGSIGWVPLGPREPYHPWYRASPAYVRQVNISHVTNITINNVTINNYVNRGAATSIPAAAMMASRPVQAVARPVTPQEFAQARPIVGQQPLRPTAATAGVTPAVARQMNLAPAAAPRTAPGPVVREQAAGPAGTPFARPPLTPAGRPEPGNPATRPPGAVPAAAEPYRAGGLAPGAHPVPNGTPPAIESNRPLAATARPATEPQAVRPTAPFHSAPPGASPAAPSAAPPPAAFRPAPAVVHPAPAPTPAVVPNPAPPPAARPEPRFAAPPPRAESTARFEPAARPAPPTTAHPSPTAAPRPTPQEQEHERKPNEH
jgi:hypothetical protein